MHAPDRLVRTLLKHGWVELPNKKHRKFRSPKGEIFVMSRSPSDFRVTKKNLLFLRRMGYDYTQEVGL